jgi:hypothetical protein
MGLIDDIQNLKQAENITYNNFCKYVLFFFFELALTKYHLKIAFHSFHTQAAAECPPRQEWLL